MTVLSPAQRAFLRSRAHALSPVVMIGDAGLTEAVINELDRSIAAHELIKVKVHGGGKEDRQALIDAICAGIKAAPVQLIGKILVLYRPAAKPRLVLP